MASPSRLECLVGLSCYRNTQNLHSYIFREGRFYPLFFPCSAAIIN
ncbi:Olfactory receptor 2Y1 [Gossypium arboreum]|uniref:Olfactory receptor 2Y1 n=1 Tax=Gossypium arboreum TaxID=29729 RepID=A0A0B0MUV4_GOSAR|nr:Olfactory receptor 2Y1 [Gossypium arboreum]